MELTPEEQAQLDALEAKKAEKAGAKKDVDVSQMSDAEVRKLAVEAIEQKRSANDEAKKYRLKLEKLEKEKTDVKQKLDDENKTATEKLTSIEAENAALKVNNLSIQLKSQAASDLLSKGFKPELVNNAVQLTGLTEDNFDEKVKSFETTFKSYLVEEKPGSPAMNRRPANNKPPPDKTDKQSLTQRVVKEMYDGGSRDS